MQSRGGRCDKLVDHGLIVRVVRDARVDELDETEEEFGDRRHVRLVEHETRRPLESGRDPRGGGGDGMVDERPQLTTPQLRSTTGPDPTGQDRQIQRADDCHGAVVVPPRKLLGEDRTVGRQVEVGCELGEPWSGRAVEWRSRPVGHPHMLKEDLRRDGFEDEREKCLADVDLTSADSDAYPWQALQVKVVFLQPALAGANVASDGWPRSTKFVFEVAKMNWPRCRVKKRRKGVELSVTRIEDPRPRGRIQAGQDRMPSVFVARCPDAQPAASDDPNSRRPEEGLDRRQVVADDPSGQLQLRRDRFHGGRLRFGKQQPRDTGLAAIERDDDRHWSIAAARVKQCRDPASKRSETHASTEHAPNLQRARVW